MKIALIILTLNEYECLKKILPFVLESRNLHSFDVIYAIDGGSTDGTVEYYQQHNIPIVAQSYRGRGAAFHLALEKIDTDGYIFFSPDGNEDPADLIKFRYYLENGADIIIASRMMQGAKNEEDDSIFKFRKWVNNAFNLMINIFFNRSGKYVTDSINGYRAITKSAMQKLSLDAMDYTIEFQMTIRAFKHKLNIVEFATCEFPRISGETKAPSFSTGLRFIKCLWKEIIHRLIANPDIRQSTKVIFERHS